MSKQEATLRYRIADAEEAFHWLQDSPNVSSEELDLLLRRIDTWKSELSLLITPR